MKARTLLELCAILLNSLKEGDKEGWFNNGLCREIDDLFEYEIITWGEREKLIYLIKTKKPTARNKFKDFYKNPLFINGRWWWELMRLEPLARQERIRFIEAVIVSLNKPA